MQARQSRQAIGRTAPRTLRYDEPGTRHFQSIKQVFEGFNRRAATRRDRLHGREAAALMPYSGLFLSLGV